MLCIRWAANAARPVDCDVIPTFHWHSSGLDPIKIIQYGFLGVGAGGVFFGHKEYPSRNIFTYSEPRAMTLVRGMGLNKPHSVHP